MIQRIADDACNHSEQPEGGLLLVLNVLLGNGVLGKKMKIRRGSGGEKVVTLKIF